MSVIRRAVLSCAACTLLASASPAAAFVMTPDRPEPFSALDQVSLTLPAPIARARTESFKGLQGDLRGVKAQLEWQKNGSFAFLRNADVGAPLIHGFTRPDAVSAERAARAFLTRYRGMFGLDQAGLGTLQVERNGVIGHTDYARGVYYVSFIQKVGGYRVYQARVTFAIHATTGDLYAVTSNLFGAPAPKSLNGFRLTPQQGALKALQAVGLSGRISGMVRKGSRYEVRIDSPDLDGPVTIQHSFMANHPGQLVPAYVALVWTKQQGLIEVGIDAAQGRHLLSNPLTDWYSYQMSSWKDYPLSQDNQINSPSLLTYVPDAAASPKGWLSAPAADGLYRTIGPNVITFYDWNGEYSTFAFDERTRTLTAPATKVTNPGTSSESVAFDYTGQWASNTDPHKYVQLSMMENFQRLNVLHDLYYKLGYTKAQGNFQDDDPVLVNAQDGYDVGTANNANFSTPPDGTSGRMNMYVFNDQAGTYKDGTMDREIFNHELGHGLSHRLVNFGDSQLSGAQSGAYGEGMSDTFAFFREPTYAAQPDLFALASYVGWEEFIYVQRGPLLTSVTGNFANDFEKPMGRFTDYTYALGDESIQDTESQRTLEHFGRLPVAWIHHGASGTRATGFRGTWSYIVNPEVHSDGEIWAAATWRARYRVATYTGWTSMTAANRLLAFEQTMLMGEQLMPANPNFLQARDGLIIYEEMTQTESASCMLKAEFARTGMGKNATAGADGNYGAKTDYDETTDTFPEILPDFAAWGCAQGTPVTQNAGDVTMSFAAPAPEIEAKVASALLLSATTPGYTTKATVTGPYVGTVVVQSTTDWINKSIAFTPTATGLMTFSATVTSTKGESKSSSLTVQAVTAIELSDDGDYAEAFVDQNTNDHFKVQIDHTGWKVGDQLSVALHSTDVVDIDLYFNIDTLALPGINAGFAADEDGDESLTLQLTSTGWQVVSESGTVYPLKPVGSDFALYLDVAGFTASNYTMTLKRL